MGESRTQPGAEKGEGTAPRCPECGAEVPCGSRLGLDHCWCMDLPRLEPDPSLPPDACLCEACLRRRVAARGEAGDA